MSVGMDTNVILKYKRSKMCWICTSCETENDTSSGKCMLCGKFKTADAYIENVWNPDIDVVHKGSTDNDFNSFENNYNYNYSDNSSDNGKKVILAVIWAVVVFAILALVAYNGF